MNSQTIKVNLSTTRVPDADSIYTFRTLLDKHGESEVFLLESLHGPAADRKSTLIGIHPLFKIDVRQDSLRVAVPNGCKNLVADKIEAAGWQFSAQENSFNIHLEEGKLWDLLRFIESWFQVTNPSPALEFNFGFFGFFGYDVSRHVERLPRVIPSDADEVLASLSIFRSHLIFDPYNGNCTAITSRSSFWDEDLSTLLESISTLEGGTPELGGGNIAPAATYQIRTTIKKAHYLDNVQKALGYIAIGDIYQVQLGHQIDITADIAPFDVYGRLRAQNPSPYMFYAALGGYTLIGASPELFLRIKDGTLCMRPLAGTIRRGKSAAEDIEAENTLRNDTKEQAEHIMLVDLCRNDVGRVAASKSLNVDELMSIERYSHVLHLVSNVTGQLDKRYDKYDALSAAFPAGTMTGAPKIRAVEIIEELETTRRGVYAGAIGLIDFTGDVNLGLCIRSITQSNGVYTIRASAGTVADSISVQEWNETISKMSAPFRAITGKELVNESAID